MSITDSLFLAVPLISTLCSLFLFLTVLGAKKNRTIYAFMLLLLSFTAWSAGSLFLRLRLYPGERFWYEVSITGIFCVPFLIYNFIYCFTGKRAPLTRLVYMVSWTVIAVLNIVDVFIKHPQIVLADGSREFNFIITPWAIIPILYAAVTLFSAGRMVVRNIRRDAVDTFKAQKKKSEITEDDLKGLEREIQDATDKYCKEIDAETAKKEKELMEL